MRGSSLSRVDTAIRSVVLGAIVALAPLGAAAATDADTLAAMQKKLDTSLKMIDALAARVRELEAKQAQASAGGAAPAAASAPADAARVLAVEQKVEQIETANATRRADDTGLPVHGFADVGAGNHNPYTPLLKGFNVGNLDFYLTPRLGERALALFELNFEVSKEGGVGVDLERAQIGYQFSDAATVWLGRFHTPYGYVNTALHHGAWISNSLRRPKFLAFEDQGGSLPAHTVGAWLAGATHVGAGKVLYDFYVGNGQEIIDGVVDMRNAGNAHGNPIVGGRIGYQFGEGSIEGLTLGVHALSSRIEDNELTANVTRLNMAGAYGVYDTDDWEAIAELYLFNNEDLSGGTGHHRSQAGFGQLGYRAAWGVPYLRYERGAFKQSDHYFLEQLTGNSYYRSALGIRFDIDIKSALKFEFAITHETDRVVDEYSEALVQYAIRF